MDLMEALTNIIEIGRMCSLLAPISYNGERRHSNGLEIILFVASATLLYLGPCCLELSCLAFLHLFMLVAQCISLDPMDV